MRLLLFCLLLGSVPVFAQENFIKHAGGDKIDRALFLTHTSDKGYMACGYTQSFGNSFDMYLVKFDQQGNVQWEKNYGGDKMDLGWSVHELADGWLLHGTNMSKDSTNQDIQLLRLDKTGNIIWEKTYGNKKEERTTCLVVDTDGNYLLIGHRVIKDSVDLDSYFLKLDTAGNILWEKTFGGPKRERSFYGVETSDGDYLISGSILPYDNGKSDLLFLKLSKNGDLIWSKKTGEKNVHDIAHSFQRNADGKTYTVSGYIESTTPGYHNALFIQVDVNGNELRRKVYQTGEDIRMMHAEETSDNGFIVAGYSRNDITKNIWDAVLLRYDSNGNVVWVKKFGTPDKDDQGYWLVCNDDGGFTMTGYSYSYGKGGDLWLIRTDANGDIKGKR